MDDLTFLNAALLLVFLSGLAGVAGFLAGFLGIGGGIVLVPGLYFVFTSLGYEGDYLMHLAVGTSLATIIVTGFSSARAHWKRKNVYHALVPKMGGGIFIGVIGGAMIASHINGVTLQLVFAVVLILLAGLMQVRVDRLPHPDFSLSPWGLGLVGSVVGLVSTLVGIGGATLNVPFMTLHKMSIHRAVGTASVLGLFIAVPGTVAFFIIGASHMEGLPPFSFGFVNLLAFAIIVPVSALVAPFGAAAIHRFPKRIVQRVFGLFIIFVAVKMLFEALRVVL